MTKALGWGTESMPGPGRVKSESWSLTDASLPGLCLIEFGCGQAVQSRHGKLGFSVCLPDPNEIVRDGHRWQHKRQCFLVDKNAPMTDFTGVPPPQMLQQPSVLTPYSLCRVFPKSKPKLYLLSEVSNLEKGESQTSHLQLHV